jgi:hypothetical protein
MIRLAPYSPPRDDVIRYDLSRTIGDKRVRIVTQWRERSGAWYYDLHVDGALVIGSRKLVAGTPLLWRHLFDGVPGDIIMMDVSGAGAETTLEGLGVTHWLFWIEDGDLSAPSKIEVVVT